jgi:hypothetical protein
MSNLSYPPTGLIPVKKHPSKIEQLHKLLLDTNITKSHNGSIIIKFKDTADSKSILITSDGNCRIISD